MDLDYGVDTPQVVVVLFHVGIRTISEIPRFSGTLVDSALLLHRIVSSV